MYEELVLQHNIGKRRAKSIDLQLRVKDRRGFIALIQEPYTYRGRVCCLDNQHTKIAHPAQKSKDSPRAIIYHHKDVNIIPCLEFTGRDIAVGIWNIGMPNMPQLVLISVYWSGDDNTLPPKLLRCLAWAAQNNLPVHLGGDLNSHSSFWGSPKDTPRGYVIEQLCFDNTLNILNEGVTPTFITKKAATIIDLTLVSPECEEYVSSWGVITTDGQVDHRPIECRYFSSPPAKKFRQSMKNVDWKAFGSDVSSRMRNWTIPRTMTRNDLDQAVNTWDDIIREVCNIHSEIKVIKPRASIASLWYTPALKEERRTVSLLCTKAFHSGLDADWECFRDARRTYSNNVRKAAREC